MGNIGWCSVIAPNRVQSRLAGGIKGVPGNRSHIGYVNLALGPPRRCAVIASDLGGTGLPGGRGRVSVRVAALEAWKDSRHSEIDSESSRLQSGSSAELLESDGVIEKPAASALVPLPEHSHSQGSRRPSKLITSAVIAAFGLGLLAAFAISRVPQHRPPALWKLVNNTLIVSDDNGAEVFKRVTPKVDR